MKGRQKGIRLAINQRRVRRGNYLVADSDILANPENFIRIRGLLDD